MDSIYVSESGDDTTGDGLSVSTAVKTISGAVAKINEKNDSSFNWKIKVNGTISGPQKIIKDVATYTDPIAASITLEGMDSGKISATGISDSALTIEVGIPVTLKNITITSSGTCIYGVGMNVQNNANVTLSDGVKVTGNRYTGPSVPSGIGIYVEDSKLTVTGTAEITNNTFSNTSISNSRGGGIYAAGNSQIVVSGSSKITGNSASQGDGVCLSAKESGTSSLEIRDNAQVQDVYLNSNNRDYVPYLKADEAFTATGIVVKMNSALYKTGIQILQGEATGSVYDRFSVPGVYDLSAEGTLSKKDDANITLADISAMPFVNAGSFSDPDSFEPIDVLDKLIIFKIPSGSSYIYKGLKVSELFTATTFTPASFTNYSDGLAYTIDSPAGINLTTNGPYLDISSDRPTSGASFIDFDGGYFYIGGTGLGYMILE
ncbi:MAG: right-handed parallel beta-helix repeat-containing protein [Treponema sp.]|nr:right-handed parallel beta-helix repeat-containing protein [Treponema sp.]